MTDQSPPVVDLLERDEQEAATTRLEETLTKALDDRQSTMRALRTLATDRPEVVAPVCPTLERFLEDDDRSVRLSTAKLFAALADASPDTVVPQVPALADRLADESEFYYVRARSAEALGYVAVEHPDVVGTPETVADLRIGLSFDEQAVREKLAKALEHVALGDPSRLRHHVGDIVEHLDDDSELVRYHLCTTLVVVGCEHPETLEDARELLRERLADESDHVSGRAAEALGVFARAVETDGRLGEELQAEGDQFLTDRVAFALDACGATTEGGFPETVGTLEGVAETTAPAVDAITSPDGDCPQCGLELPENGPPMCPRCGAPY